MVKIQPCRNRCGQTIAVQLEESSGKWKPYNVNEDGEIEGLHDCPNSEYKKKQALYGGTNKQGQFVEARETEDTALMIMNKKLDDLVKLQTQILLLLKTPFIDKDEMEKSKAIAAEEEEGTELSTLDKEDEYGF